jgi:hypothetical protein
MKQLADSIDESFIKVARAQVSKGNIKNKLKSIGLNNDVSESLSRKIEKEIINNKESKILFEEGLSKLAEKTKISEDILSSYVAGNSLSSFSKNISGNTVRAIVSLPSMMKYSPLLADTVNDFIQPAINLTLKSNAKNELVKQSIQTIGNTLDFSMD